MTVKTAENTCITVEVLFNTVQQCNNIQQWNRLANM